MVLLPGFCIDAYEAHLLDQNQDLVLSPYESPKGRAVRAAVAQHVFPQGYISQQEASAACRASGKRLCSDQEWLTACRGTPATRYPYGTRGRAGYCNDAGREALPAVFGAGELFTLRKMNDSRLNQVAGTLAPTGSFPACRSDVPLFDMVGNLHEWTADKDGTLRGGFYLDTESLGQGCEYAAIGHDASYADYTTGFRCCQSL